MPHFAWSIFPLPKAGLCLPTFLSSCCFSHVCMVSLTSTFPFRFCPLSSFIVWMPSKSPILSLPYYRPDLATKAPLSEKINIVIRIFIKNNTIGGSVGLLEYIPKYTLEKKDFACLTLEGKWFIQAITWCIWWSKSVWVKSWYCKRFLMHQS